MRNRLAFLCALFLPMALAGLPVLASAAPAPSPRETPAEADGAAVFKQHLGGQWRTPRPPYPAQTRPVHDEGIVYLCLKTDAAGKIVEATVPEKPASVRSTVLSAQAMAYALKNWSGPPNATAKTCVEFKGAPRSAFPR